MALSGGGYLDGGHGPDYTDFIKISQFAEVNRENRIRFQLTVGLRFDRNDIFGDILNFRSGIMLRPLPNYTFRGLFG